MISITHVSKSFGKKGEIKALQDINLEVQSGELFGLIGPDGAGKTTLFRVLTTLMLADQGTASVVGLDVVKDLKEIRKVVGYMPGRFSLYQDLSVEENLNFYATIFNTTVQQNYHLIKDIYIQLEPFKKRRAGALSGGMKQKLALCCALIHKPKVLFLDEPTTGVDVVSRKEFWDMLKKLKSEGITIFVSTPYMDEAALCDRIALINEGKIMKIESPVSLIHSFSEDLFSVKTFEVYTIMKILKDMPDINEVYPFGDNLHLVSPRGKISVEKIEHFLLDKGASPTTINKILPTIEDVFMHLMRNHHN